MKAMRFKGAAAATLGLGLAFVLAIGVIAISLVQERRNAALQSAQAQAERFLSGAEASINRNLLGLDVLLASMDKLLNLSNSMPGWIDSGLSNVMIQNSMRQNLLTSRVALVDERGMVLASSDEPDIMTTLQLPERFVAEVLAQPLSMLVISGPVNSFRSSDIVVYLGRYVKLADSSRVITVAEVPVRELTAILMQNVDINGLETTIEHADGELLIASPLSESPVGKYLEPPLQSLGAPGPVRTDQTRLSKEPGLVLVRNSMYGGVFLTASIANSAALQEGHREALLIMGVAVVLTTLVVAATGFALWHLNRMTNAQLSLAEAKGSLDRALESMVSGFILLDNEQRVLNWNKRFVDLHPWLSAHMQYHVPFRDLAEITCRRLLPNASDAERTHWLDERMKLLTANIESRQLTTPEGLTLEITERSTPDGGTVIVYQDVSRLRQATADVELLAFYDPLTGLPNRRLLNDRLQQAIHSSVRTGRHGALLFLDLDHFKTLNDTLGHVVGDMLLQQVAQRLKAAVRDEDTVARLGGDEFVVMLQSLSADALEAAAQTQKVGQAIVANMNLPFQLQGNEHTSTCSVGATLFGKQEQEAAELLKQADIAMYQVKGAGRNDLCFFDPQMLADITVRADMERDLRHALSEQQFCLHYQVQVASHGRPVGAEVLIRWMHPEKGMIPPLEFIGLAEETGLIIPIGEWVLKTACRQLKAWQTVPSAVDLQLAVNVSARQFRAPDFVEMVQRVLEETGAPAHLLELELTESLVLDNIKDAIDKMQALKNLGLRFSMDDFGTGYSSLAYLTRLPLNQLKIDQSFVRNIGQQASDSAVIDTIIGLAKSLGLDVIAEGVETNEQREFLEAHGCTMCQGYLFGKPTPVLEFEAWLLPNRIAL